MTNNVACLDDYRPHTESYVACMACGKDWVAVYPVGVPALECPSCHKMTGEVVRIENSDWFTRFNAVKTKKDRTTRMLVCLNANRMGWRKS